ncbi:hypothetical protein ACRAWD_16125 [Caulobacter segnis]
MIFAEAGLVQASPRHGLAGARP